MERDGPEPLSSKMIGYYVFTGRSIWYHFRTEFLALSNVLNSMMSVLAWGTYECYRSEASTHIFLFTYKTLSL